ncbi:hypothetical protein BEP19_01800 [Ammoniphilus oxalaticus]|uniref:Heptaprenyl diphosphate synthase n=1 Tax=Ammoniphilus oxalaticus TaxID=66863 RepID=A0A419SNA8_9BACL|nr:heptaprenyl diphosphate synthase component 1 [Ammoniphilus oxalaticus]RKD25699.1 hypothetical protein BEP19_01800 [Ammoniphilus oxalaticus]
MKQVSQRPNGDFFDILSEVRKQAECEFVQRYVEVPSIPMLRMKILFLFLQDSGVPMDKIKDYLVPTILIQMGLDCHDEVTLFPQTTERGVRERQLSVLAGDYYSSKYYFLLSEIEDIGLIRHLALAVSEINELKTKLYTTRNMNVALSFYMQHQIDASLYMGFYTRFGKSPIWKEIMESVVMIERSIVELEESRIGQVAPRFLRNRAYEVNLDEAHDLLEQSYEEAFEKLQKLLKFTNLHHVREEMVQLMQGCQQRMNHQWRVSDGLRRGV